VVTGNGVAAEEIRLLDDFSSVEVSTGLSVSWVLSPTPQVWIQGDENVLSQIRAEVSGTRLEVRLPSGITSVESINPLQITVYSRQLAEVRASGGSLFSGGGISADQFKVEASGGSQIGLAGAANRLRLDLSGGAVVGAFELPVLEVDVQASGGSEAQVRASNSVRGSLSGGSRLFISGQPGVIQVTTSGGAQVVQYSD
jgi:hypothetical protein